VGHARRQQPDGRHFFSLRELGLKLDALGDVIHDNQAADDAESLGHQRGNGNVGNAGVSGRGVEAEFI